jgi:hypothetical protein
MKGKAIIVRNLNNDQLNMLIGYLVTNHYKWLYSGVDKKSITRSDVLYMENDNSLSYSSLVTFKQCFKDDYELVGFNDLIQMKKSDLKPGMVVEYANGERRLVVTINNDLYLISRASFADVKSFNDDLTCDSDLKLNIVKVFQPKEAASLSSLLDCSNCIWERPKEIVLTMQEIADKFGIPVEQLRIKK